jgi:hypothetical protein
MGYKHNSRCPSHSTIQVHAVRVMRKKLLTAATLVSRNAYGATATSMVGSAITTNLASVSVKMFSHLVLSIRRSYNPTWKDIWTDNAAVNSFTVQNKKKVQSGSVGGPNSKLLMN